MFTTIISYREAAKVDKGYADDRKITKANIGDVVLGVGVLAVGILAAMNMIPGVPSIAGYAIVAVGASYIASTLVLKYARKEKNKEKADQFIERLIKVLVAVAAISIASYFVGPCCSKVFTIESIHTASLAIFTGSFTALAILCFKSWLHQKHRKDAENIDDKNQNSCLDNTPDQPVTEEDQQKISAKLKKFADLEGLKAEEEAEKLANGKPEIPETSDTTGLYSSDMGDD